MESLGPYELNTAILGDCLEKMGPIPDNSIDSIVCDPPYGLSKEPDMTEVLTHWLNGDDYEHRGGGFMGRDWDSFVPGPAIWRECYRVLKPGGCLMAFGGTRTCDLLSIAIRLAGFQRFDQIVWIHGQGFAKGADVSKKLDAMAGMEREVIGKSPHSANRNGTSFNGAEYKKGWTTNAEGERTITAPATEAAALWSGWRSQLKPAHEVILCFWKPREKSFAFNALKYGVSGLNIDGCRIPTNGDQSNARKDKGNKLPQELSQVPPTVSGTAWDGQTGRFPSNVLISHHPACVRVGVKQVRGRQPRIETTGDSVKSKTGGLGLNGGRPIGFETSGYADPDGLESVPDYRCHPDCPVWQLDRQAGVRKSGGKKNGRQYEHNYCDKTDSEWQRGDVPHYCYGDQGSASRFYYTPKAPPREKWFYCEICDDVYPYKERDNHAHGKPKGQRKHQIAHPTVKPLAINNYLFGVLEYLCRLTKTPTGGIVLDPFGGSGTTGLAAIAARRPFLLIENDPIYHRIAEKRIEQAMKEPHQLKLI